LATDLRRGREAESSRERRAEERGTVNS
jgi:hypothetical protein